MLKQKRAGFSALFKEFVDSYLPTSDGRDHIRRYAEERKEGRQNFEAIAEAADGEEVADQILLKLPHARQAFPALASKKASSRRIARR
jgi:5-methylcytosine-specific restriction enzyme B